MKSLLLRLDTDLEQKFADLCQQRGYSKNGVLTRLIRELLARESRDSGEAIQDAVEFGIDLSLLRDNLRRSPTERLAYHEQARQMVTHLRDAGTHRD